MVESSLARPTPARRARPLSPTDLSAARRYAIAVVVALVATAVTATVTDSADQAYFPAYLLAVALATVLGGIGPGLVALLLSAVLEVALFLEPKNSLTLDDAEDVQRVAGFLLAGAALAVVAAMVRRGERRARAARAQVESFVEEAPMGLGFVDADLRFTHVNAALASLTGRSPADLVGEPLADVLPDPFAVEFEAGLRRTLATGRTVADVEIATRRAGEGEAHWVATFYPLPGPEGTPAGAGAVLTEVTARKAAENRLRFLSEASGLLESPLSSHERLQLLVRLVVPHVADAALFEAPGAGGRPEVVALGHRDPAAEALMRRLRDRWSPTADDDGVARVLRTGRTTHRLEVDPEVVADLAGEAAVRADLRALDVRSFVIVPLTARGRRIGALTLLCTGARRFTAHDVAFAEELGRRAALALDNARLLEQQTKIAHTLQQSLLPPSLPEVPGAELAARYRPVGEGTEVGGDFYDAFRTTAGWLLTIGDACGKGVEAATVTALARHTIRALAFDDRRPSAVLRGLNESLAHAAVEQSFLTAAIVHVTPHEEGLHIVVAVAGHPLPLVVRTDGQVERVGTPGTLLGPFVEGASFTDVDAVLRPGDTLVLVTDGVLEARDGATFYGEERLQAVLARCADRDAHAVVDGVEHDVAAFQRDVPTDDMAVVALRAVGVLQPIR